MSGDKNNNDNNNHKKKAFQVQMKDVREFRYSLTRVS